MSPMANTELIPHNLFCRIEIVSLNFPFPSSYSSAIPSPPLPVSFPPMRLTVKEEGGIADCADRRSSSGTAPVIRKNVEEPAQTEYVWYRNGWNPVAAADRRRSRGGEAGKGGRGRGGICSVSSATDPEV